VCGLALRLRAAHPHGGEDSRQQQPATGSRAAPNPSGRELFYRSGTALMTVPVSTLTVTPLSLVLGWFDEVRQRVQRGTQSR
jgi:hypothetical protein